MHICLNKLTEKNVFIMYYYDRKMQHLFEFNAAMDKIPDVCSIFLVMIFVETHLWTKRQWFSICG